LGPNQANRVGGCGMRGMSYSASQSIEAQFTWSEQLSRWITSLFWCGALFPGKIAYLSGMSMFIRKQSLLIFISFRSLSTRRKPLGFHMIVSMNSLLWISRFRFVTMWSLDIVHMRRGNALKKNHHEFPVIRWCQLSGSAA
jgi:hypothetical protein